ncbi:MAG: DMT family transporter [Bacteriovoracaceae bacterium]|nr:DMT family transporter [Bacteriovoracaceae bacterium]
MSFFGSATPVSKLVGNELPIFSASLLRVGLATIVLAPFALKDFRNKLSKFEKKDWLYVGGISIFGMVGFTLLLIYGMKHISGVAGSLIMSITPAITAIGAHFFLNSPLGKGRIFAIALGVAGVVVVNVFKGKFSQGESDSFMLGALMVFLAVCCEACYTMLGKKITKDVDPLFASFVACIISIPLFLGLATIDFDMNTFSKASSSTWWAVLWWGMVTLGAGSALWYKGVAKAKGTTSAGMMSVMPISALLISYFLLGEKFHMMHLVGIGFVFSSVLLMSWIHYKEAKEN